jgi:GT2 family glycosyltransferase
MDRPEVLARCLTSITSGLLQPEQIIVSDDSKASSKTRELCESVENVSYFEGPRRGLCANRNFVIKHAKTEFVSLIDDDAMVSKNFVKEAIASVQKFPEKTIFTGPILEAGKEIIPSNPSFWGHFTKPVEDRHKNINLNCNIFPRHAFAVAKFDEAIQFGYEDTDLCGALIYHGYKIEFIPSLRNEHAPPARVPSKKISLSRLADKARFYTSIKRYLIWEKRPVYLILYIFLGPLHRAFSATKRADWAEIRLSFTDMYWAVSTVWIRRKSLASIREQWPAQ